MKRFLSILFLGLLLCTAAYAESEEVLDLTALSGNMLTDRLSEIRSNPEEYAGRTLRIRGKYYGYDTEEGMYRSLIVCDSCNCSEVGITLTEAEGAELSWPEINQSIEIAGTVELYDTSFGTKSARLAVESVVSD